MHGDWEIDIECELLLKKSQPWFSRIGCRAWLLEEIATEGSQCERVLGAVSYVSADRKCLRFRLAGDRGKAEHIIRQVLALGVVNFFDEPRTNIWN